MTFYEVTFYECYEFCEAYKLRCYKLTRYELSYDANFEVCCFIETQHGVAVDRLLQFLTNFDDDFTERVF